MKRQEKPQFIACLHAIIFALLLAATPVAADPKFAWPEGRHASIVLTYDDAIAVSDLDVAIPQLDRAGLTGTFFLMGKAVRSAEVARWRAAAASGHELGNHTVNHPCLRGTYPMPAQYNSENYSIDVLLTEVGVMNTLLTAIDGKGSHAFATPCGHSRVGGDDYLAPLQAAGLVSYIRDPTTMTARPGGPPVLSTGFVGASGAEMIAWVRQVEASGGLGVIVFHGVGGDYLAVTAEAHRQLLDYLAAHRADIWTVPFSAAMGYLAGHSRQADAEGETAKHGAPAGDEERNDTDAHSAAHHQRKQRIPSVGEIQQANDLGGVDHPQNDEAHSEYESAQH